MYKVKFLALLAASTFMTFSLLTNNVQAPTLPWFTQIVDGPPDSFSVGWFCSLALDSQDRPHISYFEDDSYGGLKYAKWTGTEWVTEVVDPGNGPYPDPTAVCGMLSSIALDSSDMPHIVYHDGVRIMFARWTGRGWSFEIVPGTLGRTQVGVQSLALDSQDWPHIMYHDFHGNVMYTKKNLTGWVTEEVDSGVPGFGSIALDSQDKPHMSIAGFMILKYAWRTDRGWLRETIPIDSTTNPAATTSIALDSEGKPRISYTDLVSANLKYAWRSGSGSWSIETVDSNGYYSSLAIDSLDNAQISYQDWSNMDLMYAWETGTGFLNSTVDTGVEYGISLALDSKDMPHIAYHVWQSGVIRGELKYARLDYDEYFSNVSYSLFDSDGDGDDDSIEIEIDVDCAARGLTLDVTVEGFLIYSSGGLPIASDSSTWTITGMLPEYGYLNLQVPSEASEGWFNIQLHLYDDWGVLEDSRLDSNVAYLFPAAYPWDITGLTMWVPDGKCDMRDVALVCSFFGALEGDGRYDVRADITGPTYLVPDGKIDLRDVALVAKHYGEIY